ncbi:DUF6482 family protein [Pseudomonas sp. GV071]|jgi:hypothetical protein|uniref:DUF6482 family protein n=1 Tax=Pseudomonas sp. GV071 TaxID=2135754 RepID=UPI000D338AA8|nr:DUF6482 family protein [Pseudomonas sp. GV071]PTQ66919.1 hypothetical protein C8K61_11859 [Pseudomonas sp. GV071]
MNIQDIYEYAAAGDLQGLELLSIEGGIYLLQAQVENRLHAVRMDDGNVLRLRSVTQARELLEGLRTPVPFHLVQCETHGEMCGCQTVNEPIREPIALRSRG